MKKDIRVWIDLVLLLTFPITVVTGLFHGPGYFPCYWHTGSAFFLILFVVLHLLVNEHNLRRIMKRFSELLFGAESSVSFEEIFREEGKPDAEEPDEDL